MTKRSDAFIIYIVLKYLRALRKDENMKEKIEALATAFASDIAAAVDEEALEA